MHHVTSIHDGCVQDLFLFNKTYAQFILQKNIYYSIDMYVILVSQHKYNFLLQRLLKFI